MRDLYLSEELLATFSKRQIIDFTENYTKFEQSNLFSNLDNKTPERLLSVFLGYLKTCDKPVYKSLLKKLKLAEEQKIKLYNYPF